MQNGFNSMFQQTKVGQKYLKYLKFEVLVNKQWSMMLLRGWAEKFIGWLRRVVPQQMKFDMH